MFGVSYLWRKMKLIAVIYNLYFIFYHYIYFIFYKKRTAFGLWEFAALGINIIFSF